MYGHGTGLVVLVLGSRAAGGDQHGGPGVRRKMVVSQKKMNEVNIVRTVLNGTETLPSSPRLLEMLSWAHRHFYHLKTITVDSAYSMAHSTPPIQARSEYSLLQRPHRFFFVEY